MVFRTTWFTFIVIRVRIGDVRDITISKINHFDLTGKSAMGIPYDNMFTPVIKAIRSMILADFTSTSGGITGGLEKVPLTSLQDRFFILSNFKENKSVEGEETSSNT